MAQLVTSTSQTPAQLVQNVLLGQGVDVFNIHFTGAQQAIGSFDATNTTLGFDKGIIITTGTVNNIANGPQGPNDRPNATINNNAGGNPRLSALVGNTPTYNSAILEFDFIPYSDTVTFRYIFGSEEYREYVKTEFNDVFAFFISGPGYTGYQNIALLPNQTPVTINNINDGYINNGIYHYECNNCQYYVNNGNGSQAPYNQDPQYIQYDGFTKPLKAVAPVQCGKKYHLIIGIADVSDALYDSGIFLEANSLNSNITAKVDYSLSFDAFGDGKTMSEGCASATFNITRPADKAQMAMTIPITVGGTATMGTDYNNIPSSVTFQPGETLKTFTITPVQDNLTEGVETIELNFQIPNACGDMIDKTVELQIHDIDSLTLSIDGEDKLCPNQDVVLTANPQGGSGPYQYLWSNGETSNSISVSPNSTQTYSVTVTESCMQKTSAASYTVNVIPYTPMTLTPSPDILEPCRYKNNTLSVAYSGGAPNYSIEWHDSTDYVFSNDSVISVAPGESTTYSVSVTDACGFKVDTVIHYTITTPPLVVDTISTIRICPGEPVQFSAHASGGYGAYQYHWSNGTTGPTLSGNPNNSVTYTVTVTDECQTYSVATTAKVKIEVPKADFEVANYPLTQNIDAIFENTSSPNSVAFDWDFGDPTDSLNTSTLKNPTHIYADSGGYIIRLIATSDLGCSDTVYKAIEVMPEYYIYVPNAFTPNDDRNNPYFSISTINIASVHLHIYNRWGEMIYESDDKYFRWDGTYKGKMVPDDVYVWVIDYTNNFGLSKRIVGHVTVIR